MYAVDLLQVMGLPEDLIDDVRHMLNEQAEALESAKPSAIGAVFGGSDQGAQLGHHAALARAHVAKSVLQMAEGLRGFSVELAGHRDRVTGADTTNAVDLKRIEVYAGCVAPPDYTNQSNNACTLPTAGEG